jgi:uncharacterized membrane protein
MNEIKNENDKNKENKRSYLKIIFIAVIIVIIVLAILYVGKFRPAEPAWTMVEPVNNEIRINISEINDGKLHFFKTEGAKYGFFVIKTPDDQIKTRISICEPCEGISFHIKDNGNTLVCDKCGTTWDTTDFSGLSGGCMNDPPPELEYQIEVGYIIINETEL